MAAHNLIVVCFSLLLGIISASGESDDGFCTSLENREKVITKMVTYFDLVTAYDKCPGYYFKKCLQQKYVPKTRADAQLITYSEVVRRCCDGYASLGDRCIPICTNHCFFGNCTAPNFCTCYEGYEKDTKLPNKCVPMCDGCEHGTCIHPNLCYCNEGYDWDSTECKPRCSNDCENGECTAPETCTCHEGYHEYRTHDINLCMPKCEPNCVHGKCVAPNKCECVYGFNFKNGSQHECEPVCEVECLNGKCVGPNQCECHEGYTVHDEKPHDCHCGKFCVEVDGLCHCLDETERVSGAKLYANNTCTEATCINGFCVTPDYCECHKGFVKTENGTCAENSVTCIDADDEDCMSNSAPSSSTILCECINGICTQNNSCVCIIGYHKLSDRPNKCVPYCDRECVNGYCNEPNLCECDEGYRYNFNESAWNICLPICDLDSEDTGCVNGTCIAPGVCECFENFELSHEVNFTCVFSEAKVHAEARKSTSKRFLAGFVVLLVVTGISAYLGYMVYMKYRSAKYETNHFSTVLIASESNDL